MNVPLLDLKAQYAAIKDEIEPEVAEVWATLIGLALLRVLNGSPDFWFDE